MVAQGLPSCGILMRVLKDICRRVSAWGVLDSWVRELCMLRNTLLATAMMNVYNHTTCCMLSLDFGAAGAEESN